MNVSPRNTLVCRMPLNSSAHRFNATMSGFFNASARGASVSQPCPAARHAPTSAPMLVPTISVTTSPDSATAFHAPTCAIPFTPPPPSTITTRFMAPPAHGARDRAAFGAPNARTTARF